MHICKSKWPAQNTTQTSPQKTRSPLRLAVTSEIQCLSTKTASESHILNLVEKCKDLTLRCSVPSSTKRAHERGLYGERKNWNKVTRMPGNAMWSYCFMHVKSSWLRRFGPALLVPVLFTSLAVLLSFLSLTGSHGTRPSSFHLLIRPSLVLGWPGNYHTHPFTSLCVPLSFLDWTDNYNTRPSSVLFKSLSVPVLFLGWTGSYNTRGHALQCRGQPRPGTAQEINSAFVLSLMLD